MQFYTASSVSTSSGHLTIKTGYGETSYRAFDEDSKKSYMEKKFYTSGMVQSWNKFCFTGGIMEVSAKLPGKSDVGGMWPAIWLLGNLARGTYVGR